MDILKNMGNIQQKIKESQAKLQELRAKGSAGGNMVEITLAGDMSVIDVKINPDIVDPEDVETLEVLIKSAHIDAVERMRSLIQENMGSLGIPLPPGMSV